MKNKYYPVDDEMHFFDLIKILYRKKFIILLTSLTCGVLVFLSFYFKPQKFIAIIAIENPPLQLFQPYLLEDSNDKVIERYNIFFKRNFLNIKNLENFLEQSREFDNFKKYLKLNAITSRSYFLNSKFEEVIIKEKNGLNKYSIYFSKEMNGGKFITDYSEFIKKKTISEVKDNIKSEILNTINIYEHAYETAKAIGLEGPSLVNDSKNGKSFLFHKGIKVLSNDIIYFKRMITKLENDQINYNQLYDEIMIINDSVIPLYFYFLAGFVLGLGASIIIISLTSLQSFNKFLKKI